MIRQAASPVRIVQISLRASMVSLATPVLQQKRVSYKPSLTKVKHNESTRKSPATVETKMKPIKTID
jgi:hypothetical protein